MRLSATRRTLDEIHSESRFVAESYDCAQKEQSKIRPLLCKAQEDQLANASYQHEVVVKNTFSGSRSLYYWIGDSLIGSCAPASLDL